MMSLHSSFKIEFKWFIILSISIIILIIVQFFLWNFVEVSANKLQEKRTQEDQLYNLQERIIEVRSTFDNQQSLLDQLEVIFPKQESISQAVERLESMAEERNIALAIRNINEIEKEELIELEVSVLATGTAPSLLQYIDEVEHVSELTMIQRWSLEEVTSNQNEADGVSDKLYDLSMQVIFYMQSN